MEIRRGKQEDIDKILSLLNQVLEIHANIRPDIFISGKTKYTRDMFLDMLADNDNPIYVVDENGVVAYAFCQIKMAPFSTTMHQNKELFIDDLCVDESQRGKGTGKLLFDFLKKEAKRIGCYELTLNVWEGNDSAKAFYDKMGMKVKEYTMEYILKEEK